MNYQFKPLRPMRTAFNIVYTLAMISIAGVLTAQTGFQVVTGPTSFTGASNLEDGIQIASTGAYSTQFSMFTDILPYCSADADFNWGSLGLTAAERRSEISEWYGFGAGLRLHQPYDAERIFQPWLGLGVSYVQQANYADLADADGQAYFYWSDGKVYNMAEDETNANVLAQELVPDYAFESQTANQSSIAIPIRFGMNLNLTPRVYANAAFAVMAGTEASLDPRPGYTDYLTTAQAGFGIRIGKAYAEPRIELPEGWAELGNDFDQDGVKDSRDRCPGTPLGAATDQRGCPTDSDGDGVADYRDEEPFSPHTRVNLQGVALSDAQWDALRAQAQTESAPALENFKRIETKSTAPTATPVDAHGRTPAELRLLRAFGSEKTTVKVKATRSTASAVPAVRSESFSSEEIDSYRAVMPAIRPAYRVQLAPDVRTLNMNDVTPFLLSGEVTQKFDQSSAMTFVTRAVFSPEDAENDLEKMRESGFDEAFIVGEFNGRIIDVASVEALSRKLTVDSGASK